MNPIGTTIEQLLETSIDKLEAMTDAELEAFFESALKMQPQVLCMEPVGDAEPRQVVSLRGARGGTPLRKKTKSEFTLEPQSQLAKQMTEKEKLEHQKAVLERMMKMLD